MNRGESFRRVITSSLIYIFLCNMGKMINKKKQKQQQELNFLL